MHRSKWWRGLAGVVGVWAGTMILGCYSSQYDAGHLTNYVGPATQPAWPVAGVPAEPTAPQPATAASQPTTGAFAPPTGPAVTFDVRGAVLLALEHNQGLVVQKYAPLLTETAEDQARAAFDPDFTASLAQARTRTLPLNAVDTNTTTGALGWTQFLPSGTTVGGTFTGSFASSDPGVESSSSRLGLSVTQSLLRNFGEDVNLVSLRQARLNTLNSEYQLRGFAEALVAQVEEAYWDYALAIRQIEIFTQSWQVAKDQLNETKERIRVGKLAELEVYAAEAEVSSREELLIAGRANLATTRLNLLRLVNPGGANMWVRDVTLLQQPTVTDVVLGDVEQHVRAALLLRPDLNEARLEVQNNELQIVKTKNGLLPRLDLFATLGKSGYAESFGTSMGHIFNHSAYDASAGLSFEFPPYNRAAKASDRNAVLSRDQSVEAVGNLEQLAQVDVRSGYINVSQLRQQVVATAVTRHYQEESAKAEQEKFRVGKSTSLLVAQAQRDLLQAQITEIQAVVAYVKSAVEFYRQEGTLLARRGIGAPGARPVDMRPPMLIDINGRPVK